MLLDEAIWEAACPNRVRAASRALGRLIRFYISIEDGECSVERDLAQFREQKMQHRTGDMDFHDDALMVKLNGPSTLAQFSEGVADAQVEVPPFTRACASLWRETFGARHGHVNLKATAAARLARQQKPGAFAGASRGVLGAARQAVADARCGRGAGPSSFHSGAGTEASVLWNDSIAAAGAMEYEGATCVTEVSPAASGALTAAIAHRGGCCAMQSQTKPRCVG